MKQIITILFILFSLLTNSQNLVPNPSFEDTLYCPPHSGEMNSIDKWYQPTLGTSDYFNTCSANAGIPSNMVGIQSPNSGNAYTGVGSFFGINEPDSSYREYIGVKLIDTLVAGLNYYVEFYISLADSSNYAHSIGAYFSQDSIYVGINNFLQFSPQISTIIGSPELNKINWSKISGTFVAQGGEKFLIIGNFQHHTTIDTISVIGGSSCCPGNTYGYYYIDDVLVIQGTVGIHEQLPPIINIYPNPTSGNVIIELKEEDNTTITIYNFAGKTIFSKQYSRNKLIEINLDAPSGLYFVKIETENGTFTEKIIKQ